MSREIHPLVRHGARQMLRRRAMKLLALLDDPAMPDNLVANHGVLVGKAAIVLDPYGLAERRAQDADVKARSAFGVCKQLGCDAHAAELEYCARHEAEYQELVAQQDSPTESTAYNRLPTEDDDDGDPT